MDDPQVAGKSHGHVWTWLDKYMLIACKTCGIVRRWDDKNKPCKGPARVRPRNDNVLGREDE
jgi:hypothetical protein